MSSYEEAKKRIQSEAFDKLKRLFPELNFEEELKQNPELADYIRHACSSNAVVVEDPKKRSDTPKLNEDFSKYFVINNLPKCDEAKSKKLIQLLTKLLAKKNIIAAEEDITMPMNGAMTEGVAFVLLSNEE